MELVKNDIIQNKINTKLLKSITVGLLLILLYGINNTYVYYTSLTPFGVGMVLSLLFIGFNGYVLGVEYVLSILLTGFSFATILQGINVCLVIVLIEWLRSKKHFRIKKWYLFAFMILSLITYIASSILGRIKLLAVVVSIVLGLLFLFACVVFLDATIGKGMLDKINLDEKICGCIILIIFSIGICGSNIYILNLGLMFAPLILLIVNKLSSASITILSSVLIGCGFSIYYLDPIYISLLIVMSIVAIAFKCNCRYLSVIGLFLGYILFVLFFDMGIVLGEVLSVVVGCLVYLVLPNKVLGVFSTIVSRSTAVIMNTVFNNGKQELIGRIRNLSAIFKEMDSVYRNMVKGNLCDESAKTMIKDELVQSVCIECVNRDSCYRGHNSYMEDCLEQIVSVGYDKGKLSLIDLPEFLTTNCSKVSSLVQCFNGLISSYNDYKTAVNNVDTSRVLIAEQLGAVSGLLETLSNEVNININPHNPIEDSIKERLSYAGVLCIECVVYERSTNHKIINLIVKKSQYNDNIIIKTVNKLLKSKYKIDAVRDSAILGAVDVVMSNSPNYDIVFGSSSIAQTGNVVSGDNHSVVPIGDDKYMVSICDGMGTGNAANNISRLTISLIENFYKAGFDNEVILRTVNKLLSLNETERFSTIDLCLIDTRKNIYDFIKLAACEGYIKRSTGEVEVVSGSGLPIGVLDNVSPHITKLCISNMDMIVLVSDGVSDVLGEDLKFLISTIDTINPQTMADEILQKAIDNGCGVSGDDMTVICVRVFESV